MEFCRLAGKRPAGVICELVDQDEEMDHLDFLGQGDMMRRDACLRFGKNFGLKVCTIEDLVEYVKREGKALYVNGKA